MTTDEKLAEELAAVIINIVESAPMLRANGFSLDDLKAKTNTDLAVVLNKYGKLPPNMTYLLPN